MLYSNVHVVLVLNIIETVLAVEEVSVTQTLSEGKRLRAWQVVYWLC